VTARQQWLTVLGAVCVLAIALAAATHFLGDELFPVTVGSPAPPIVAASLDAPKDEHTITDYKGKVVLLNVWATWCEPCRVEMPSIEKLHQEFGPRGLVVLGVSVDDPGADDAIRDFVKEYDLTFTILHDAKQQTKTNYQVTGFPETFVIGREGTIRKKVIGAADWSSESNRALIRELLGASSASPASPAPPPLGDTGRGVPVKAR
jgi:cytochrome c biogenesis protein CcmG/thiol:disulfide interchange protein DsbE